MTALVLTLTGGLVFLAVWSSWVLRRHRGADAPCRVPCTICDAACTRTAGSAALRASREGAAS